MEHSTYDYWNARLNGQPYEIPAHVAPPGYYRATNIGQPVAVWISSDDERLEKTGAYGQPREVTDSWTERVFVYCEAVSEEAYHQAIKSGIWPDHKTAPHNEPPSGLEEITATLDDLRLQAQEYLRAGEAKSQTDADAAANMVRRIQDLVEQLEAERDTELAPLDERLREIDRQRQPIVRQRTEIFERYAALTESGKGTIVKLKKSYIEPFLVRVRQAARAALEATGAAPGGVSMRDGTVKLVTNAGGKGSRVSLTTRWSGRITDYDAALAHFKQHDKVKALVQDLANAAARSKARVGVPGVEFISEETVR